MSDVKVDIRGVEIKEGNIVALISRLLHKSGDLAVGTVVGFSKQMVTVEYRLKTGVDTKSSYMPHNLVVVEPKEETFMKQL